jgi:YggT family protein
MIIIWLVLQLFIVAILARMVFSWVRPRRDSVWGLLEGISITVTEPVLGPVRRLVPPLRLGGVAIDLSAFVVLFVANIVAARIG